MHGVGIPLGVEPQCFLAVRTREGTLTAPDGNALYTGGNPPRIFVPES